ncbi:ABC transporter substrate-binding protein [Mesorhizobium abyssinicae]|uniref:ABC transporter substrate-binding protein n=1 Tax=Mesorhizobium abyssinicae TaxID=1209958 RepID=UPI003391930D
MSDIIRKDFSELLQQRFQRGEIDRRSMLKALALLGASTMTLRAGLAKAAERTLVLANYGGEGAQAMDKFFAAPFTAATGIAVKDDTSGPSEGTIRVQAESGKVNWDVVDTDPFIAKSLGEKGYIRPVDYNIVSKDNLREGEATKYQVTAFSVGHVLIYDKTKYGDNPPRTWADFWDVKKYPGKRTFSKWMHGVLEAALMAQGAAYKDIYPIDTKRALAKVKELMPDVSAVYSSGAESQQIMLDHEASMGILWSSRAALVARDDPDFEIYFPGGFVMHDSWVVMENNPAGAEAGMKFIAAAQDPKAQVEFFKAIYAAPANPAAAKLIPAELRHYNVTDPEIFATMHALDIDWYAQNYASVLEQFQSTIAS